MCVLFYSLSVCISAYANVYFKTQAMKILLLQNNIHASEVHCGSAVRFGQALPDYLITVYHLYAYLL